MELRSARNLVLAILVLPGVLAADEPSVDVASTWWPQLTNVVTPIGWRDHPHRFCIIYDGTLIGMPQSQKLLRHRWDAGEALEGVQLNLMPSSDAALPPQRDQQYGLSLPNGKRVGDQGWAPDHSAPVLWTRWHGGEAGGPPSGVTLRQVALAHMSGGGEARSGEERMFAWIRLEVADRDASATATDCGVLVKISAPHMRFEMAESDNCRVMPANSPYPKPLRFEQAQGLLLEGDAAIRLAILPGGNAKSARHLLPTAAQRDHFVHITLPATAGAHVDLLVPMIPASREALAAEMRLGFDGALAEADRFWLPRPATAARIRTPEPLINAAIEDNVRIARMLTTTIPSTKQRAMLSGAMFYSYLWVTPSCMAKFMLLDPLGRHDDVSKYLELYRQEQGRVHPPGPDFKPHPGYFGAPDVLSSGNQWLSDHGAVVYTASRHALLTGDKQFIEQWTESILKACDFIKEARRLPRQPPAAEGVLPPGSATDISAPIQAVASDGMNLKGLVAAARLLRVMNHPRAQEFETEAHEYRQAIARAWREKAARQPRWTDSSGRERIIVPMTLTRDDSDGLGHQHPFYLDAGPLIGVYCGILPADDPLMQDAIDYFRAGPQTRGGEEGTHWNRPPRLVHEISSAEPCYSWNIFHSHQLGDRQRYLEGMYSVFTGALSRQTHISCETRGGITENVFASNLAVQLARLSVIDDEIEPGSLHLMRLTPRAWISAAEQTRFDNMPTEFGPVTIAWRLSADGGTLNVEYAPNFRRAPGRVLLHVPPAPGLKTLTINGQQRSADAGQPIELQALAGTVVP
jgi:hypothetical protein